VRRQDQDAPQVGPGRSMRRDPEVTPESAELDTAQRLGGTLTRNSGRGWSPKNKGDSRVADRIRLDTKTTTGRSKTVSTRMLRKITDEAFQGTAGGQMIPALTIRFTEAPRGVEDEWVLIPISAMRELLDQARNNRCSSDESGYG